MTAPPIQLVCFDLGRVLVRICDGWGEACDAAGIGRPAGEMSREAWAALLELIHRIEVGHGGQGGIDEFCRRAGAHLNISAEAVGQVWRKWTLGPYPGAAELIADLAAAGVLTACLSNTNIEHWTIMMEPSDPHYPVLSALRHRFASHLIGARKPDAAAYLHVERETGAAGRGIVFFDDLPENIDAAQRRGWRGRLVERCANPIPAIRAALREEGVL